MTLDVSLWIYLLLDILQLLLQLLDIGTRGGVPRPIVHQSPGESVVDVVDVVVDVAIAVADAIIGIVDDAVIAVVADAGSAVIDRSNFAWCWKKVQQKINKLAQNWFLSLTWRDEDFILGIVANFRDGTCMKWIEWVFCYEN